MPYLRCVAYRVLSLLQVTYGGLAAVVLADYQRWNVKQQSAASESTQNLLAPHRTLFPWKVVPAALQVTRRPQG